MITRKNMYGKRSARLITPERARHWLHRMQLTGWSLAPPNAANGLCLAKTRSTFEINKMQRRLCNMLHGALREP